MWRWGERKLSQLQTDFDRRSKIPCYTPSIGFDFEMPKRCVLCSKSIGLFTRQAHEVEKEGLCLCTKCYSNLWLTQPNPKSQVKTLASIALSGKLSPEIKKVVVRRIKELVPVEKEKHKPLEKEAESNVNGENKIENKTIMSKALSLISRAPKELVKESDKEQEIFHSPLLETKTESSEFLLNMGTQDTQKNSGTYKPVEVQLHQETITSLPLTRDQKNITVTHDLEIVIPSRKIETLGTTSKTKDETPLFKGSNKISEITSAPLTGHYTNKYVCVIQLEDGRFYVDYHFEKGDRPFGEGRIFNKINISGVTTDKGKHIPGSGKKLKLVAFYPCQTLEEIKEVFEIVYKEYDSNYTNVFRQKKFLAEEQKKNAKKEKPLQVIKGVEKFQFSTDSLKQFYEIIDSSFPDIIANYFFNADFTDLNDILVNDRNISASSYSFSVKRSKKNITTIPVPILTLEIDYCYAGFDFTMKCYVKKFLDDNNEYSSADVCFVNENKKTIRLTSKWTSTPNYTRLDFSLSEMPMTFFSEGIDLFTSTSVSILFEGLVFSLLEPQRKALLTFFWLYKAYKLQFTKLAEKKSKEWLKKKYLNSNEWAMYARREQVNFISIDKQNETAVVDGSKGRYKTSLKSCSCPNFQEREYFSPCKHMYALALALNKEFNPKLNMALDRLNDIPNLFFKEMLLGTNNEKKMTSRVSVGRLPFWDYPLIVLILNGSILYLGKVYGFLYDKTIQFPDAILDVLINNERVGAIYKDEEMTGDKCCFRLSGYTNKAILLELANHDSCDLVLKRNTEGTIVKVIKIRNAHGVAKLFNELFLPKGAIWDETLPES